MGRHAYMIICHNNFDILERLVNMLDDNRNDIYIHVDKKVGCFDKWKEALKVHYASLFYTKRINVEWGGYSQIKAELILLEAAIKTKHDYYHLISGVDMVLKPQKDIHQFFEINYGKEFIGFDAYSEDGTAFSNRLQYYRFFQDIIGRNSSFPYRIMRRLESVSIRIQHLMSVDRMRQFQGPVYKGSQWFSITHAMAEYVLAREDSIRSCFGLGLGVDELFLQTIAMESPYAENIVNDTLRYIDWKRGSPYTFRSDDFDELMNSGKLFARKFDAKIDMAIVDRIYSEILTY